MPPGTRCWISSSAISFAIWTRRPTWTVYQMASVEVSSPDPGRALVSGRADDFGSFDQLNAFKISPLRGIRHTAPYFHDNSARTLEDVAEHYRNFFLIVSDPDGPGPLEPVLVLTDQDKRDIVAYMKLLD